MTCCFYHLKPIACSFIHFHTIIGLLMVARNALRSSSAQILSIKYKTAFVQQSMYLSTVRRGGPGGLPTGVSGSVLILPGGEVMQIGQTIVPSTKPAVTDTSQQSLCYQISFIYIVRSLSNLLNCVQSDI
jgi:hypothetical protein